MKASDYPVLTTLAGSEYIFFTKSTTSDLANNITANHLANFVVSSTDIIADAINVGADGVGIIRDVLLNVLELKNIAAKSTRILVTDDTGSATIGIDVDEAELDLANIGGMLSISQGGTGTAFYTGSGANVFQTSPNLTTPNIGVATATSVNNVVVTAPVSPATLSLDSGSTLATDGAFAITLKSTALTNLILPTTGTLSTLSGSETLSNKKLVDSSFTIIDNSDATKQAAFQCSGISTATTRTLTVPNASGPLYVSNTRNYSSISLAFSTPRTPSVTNDTLVIATLSINCAASQTGSVDLQINTGSGFTSIATVTNTMGSLTDNTQVVPVTFLVPANSPYQLIDSGSATTSIINISEISF